METGGAVVPGRPRLPGQRPPMRRGLYLARMAAFVLVLISAVMGLASDRTGDLVWVRLALIGLASVFFVATTLDYIARSRNGL